MRIFSGALGLIILVLVLSFALSNKQDVVVTMWPFKDSLQTPLYAVALVPLALGFLLGTIQGWIANFSFRMKARKASKELNSLKTELGKFGKKR
ncbi:MAG: LapA family protein [Bdellovibrionales bacterium]